MEVQNEKNTYYPTCRLFLSTHVVFTKNSVMTEEQLKFEAEQIADKLEDECFKQNWKLTQRNGVEVNKVTSDRYLKQGSFLAEFILRLKRGGQAKDAFQHFENFVFQNDSSKTSVRCEPRYADVSDIISFERMLLKC
jgi:hypothetical protein